jgi:hypothetical protein
MKRNSNNPDAVNPAMALWLTIGNQWRRVADLEFERCDAGRDQEVLESKLELILDPHENPTV